MPSNLINSRSANTLLDTIRTLLFKHAWKLSEILPFFTANPSVFLQFKGKGFVGEGFDADLLVLDEKSLNPKFVFAKGVLLKGPNYQKTAMFPPPVGRPK